MMVPLHIRHSFNPYRVFKFVATLNGGDWHLLEDMVSIPIGFSSSLQLKGWVLSSSRSTGFNPYRVFKFVATSGSSRPSSDLCPVSIPIGFSSSLQPATYSFCPLAYSIVSIPIGFSSSLQPDSAQSLQTENESFNPYRVFKFVATCPSRRRR